ncbi:hypothetical protein HYW73_00120 [Candidatus Nomurabacteria bacterium]|nr:hypothetical protein [Candidatus Nomurabacteria bacterium]
MKNLFAVFVAVFALMVVGCATTVVSSPKSTVNTVDGPLEAKGDLNAVVKRTTTTTTTDANGIVVGTTTEVVEEQAARNAYDAEHELDMRREDRKEAVGVARAQNPAPVIVVRGSTYYRTVGSSYHRPPRRNYRTGPPRTERPVGRNTVGGSKSKR